MFRRIAVACCIVVALVAPVAGAQSIAVKTSALAQGDQFTFLPSANRGMAGVSIALRDTLLDPFVNPATGARLPRVLAYGTPSFYSLSHNGTAGSTLPLGWSRHRGASFTTVLLAVQQVDPPGGPDQVQVLTPGGGPFVTRGSTTLIPGSAVMRSHTNRFAFFGGGRSFRDSALSIGASVMWSRLSGVDGTELLYPGSLELGQHVDDVDLRLGAVRQWSGTRTLQATLLHQRAATSHDVRYLDMFWDPNDRTFVQTTRESRNYDQRHVYGVHLTYDQPLPDSGWRIGALFTANRTTQPTVPVGGIMNIGGDPGRSSAFNLGMGVSRVRGPTTAAAEVIFEPIWAQRLTPTFGVVERYRFANGILRGGVGRDFSVSKGTTVRLQGGMQLHRINYALDDWTAGVPVRSSSSWNEWTHTWSAAMRTSQFEVQYGWRLLSGVERPGIRQPDFAVRPDDNFFAPVSTLEMMPVHVMTQQFTLTMRLP